jgi:uncharacterized membrane-anchored protein
VPNFGVDESHRGAGRQAILQFVAIFNLGAGILFIPTSELQLALKRLGNRAAQGCVSSKLDNASAWRRGGSFHWNSLRKMDGMTTD